jgi:hypothetical protein
LLSDSSDEELSTTKLCLVGTPLIKGIEWATKLYLLTLEVSSETTCSSFVFESLIVHDIFISESWLSSIESLTTICVDGWDFNHFLKSKSCLL